MNDLWGSNPQVAGSIPAGGANLFDWGKHEGLPHQLLYFCFSLSSLQALPHEFLLLSRNVSTLGLVFLQLPLNAVHNLISPCLDFYRNHKSSI